MPPRRNENGDGAHFCITVCAIAPTVMHVKTFHLSATAPKAKTGLPREPGFCVFGQRDGTFVRNHAYLNVYLIGVPFMLGVQTLSSFLLAQGASAEVLKANVATSILNIALDALAIFVLGWGVTGAAAATVVSELICLGMVIRYLQKPCETKGDKGRQRDR